MKFILGSKWFKRGNQRLDAQSAVEPQRSGRTGTALSKPASLKTNGSAGLIVFMLLTLMTAFSMSNNSTLRQLKRELDLMDRRQQQKFKPGPPKTNEIQISPPAKQVGQAGQAMSKMRSHYFSGIYD